jgi:phosphatidylinositol alpha-mannosyltransferase
MLAHGEHGLLTPIDDHEAVAAAVFRLLADPALTARLTTVAHEWCRSCTWPVVRRQWLDTYRSVLPRRAASRNPVTVP